MLSPLVAVSVSASRTSLDENLEPERRSSRIWITQPNVVRVVLTDPSEEGGTDDTQDTYGSVASVVSNHIVVEGGVLAPPQLHSIPTLLSREQHIDSLASAVFHKLRSVDEVVTVMQGPSGCGKTVTLFGHELDLAHPTKQEPSATEGLLWHVLSRVFSLTSSSANESATQAVVEVGLSVIEFRRRDVHRSLSSDDDDENGDHEEAVDLLRDSVDVVTSTGAFSNMPCDVPLAQYVTCRDILEFRTALMVALSRSQSWVPDDPQRIAMSDISGESRLEHATRMAGDASSTKSRGEKTTSHGSSGIPSSHPLIPTLGSSSHLNLNIIVKVTQPLEHHAAGPTSASSSRANRALNVAQDEALPAVVDTKTFCSIWRVFDIVGPQLFDFHANPVADLADRTERSFVEAAMSPFQSSRLTTMQGPGGESNASSVVPPTLAPFNAAKDSLCAHIVTSLLRQGCAHVVWVCSLRYDYAFDELNAEAVRLASWVRERCGRSLVLQGAQKTMREKHLHVARRLMDSHALPARAFFAEVMDLRRSTVGSRYATLTYHMALEAASTTTTATHHNHRQHSTRHHRSAVSAAAVSPQSISLDGGVSEAASSEYGGVHAASRSVGRSVTSIDMSRSVSRFGASARQPSVPQHLSEERNASFALENPPQAKPIPQANKIVKPPSKGHDDIAHAVEMLEASLMSRRREPQSVKAENRDDNDDDDDDDQHSHVSSFMAAGGAPVAGSDYMAASLAAKAVASTYAAVRRGSATSDDTRHEAHHPSDSPTAPHSSGADNSWRTVLEQFRGSSGVVQLPSTDVAPLSEPHHARSAEVENLSRPSKGGTLPRGSETADRTLSRGEPTLQRKSAAASSVSGCSHPDDSEFTRLLQDECSELRAEVEVLRKSEASAHEMMRQQREELHESRQLNENLHDPSTSKQTMHNDGGAAAITQLVQPILSRLEEDAAAVIAKLLTTKRREADEDVLREAARQQPAPLQDLDPQRRGASPRKRSDALPTASIREVAELQRRIKSLQRELHTTRDQHERSRIEILDAANKSITSHKEAFTKILNESGAMYAKLNRSYHDVEAAHRAATLRLENMTEECRSLRQELSVKTTAEDQLRKAVAHLQLDKERLMHHESMQNAVTAVSTMFANASVASCDSASTTTDSVRLVNNSNSNRCVFDTSIQKPAAAAAPSILKKSRAADAATQRSHAETIGMLSFHSALNHLYRAAIGPMDALQSSLLYSVEALGNTPSATTDVAVDQVARSLESLVDEIEKRKMQTRLHVDIVKEEASKVDTMFREIQQREQQYLHVLISR